MLTRAVTFGGLLLAVIGFGTVACEPRVEAEAEAVPTRIMIRVISRDAKIIGSGVGGVMIRITDASSGELLVEGRQDGGTGNTELIMSTPRGRGMSLYSTEGAAGFLAELRLSEPHVVNISALGPLDYPQASHSASKQMLVVPGKHVEGDGVILELHGFIVEILDPEPQTAVTGEFRVRARVRMMCGCPITPGGMWDANTKEFQVRLKSGGAVVATSELRFAGEPSMFTGAIAVPGRVSGSDLQLEVLVSDPGQQNFGRHAIPLAM